MGDTKLQAMTEAAETYQDLLVPALMEEWAPRVADGAKIGNGDRVLDVACGTGVVTKEAVARGAAVTGYDLNPGMLAVAQKHVPKAGFQQGDACDMPFADGSFDAVTCMYGLMFFPDRPVALREMKRVLVPGGRLAVAVWDSLENCEAYAMMAALFDRMAGPAAGDAVRLPFALGDASALSSLLSSAGFGGVEVKSVTGKGRFPSVEVMLSADLRGWLPTMGVDLDEERIQEILQEAESVFAKYVQPDGTVLFDSPALIATGGA